MDTRWSGLGSPEVVGGRERGVSRGAGQEAWEGGDLVRDLGLGVGPGNKKMAWSGARAGGRGLTLVQGRRHAALHPRRVVVHNVDGDVGVPVGDHLHRPVILSSLRGDRGWWVSEAPAHFLLRTPVTVATAEEQPPQRPLAEGSPWPVPAPASRPRCLGCPQPPDGAENPGLPIWMARRTRLQSTAPRPHKCGTCVQPPYSGAALPPGTTSWREEDSWSHHGLTSPD